MKRSAHDEGDGLGRLPRVGADQGPERTGPVRGGRRPGHGRRAARAGTPLALALPAALTVAFLLLPLAGMVARTSWSELGTHLGSAPVREALWLSLTVSFWSLGISVVLGVPLAWMLARGAVPGKTLVRSLVLLPMVLPPTVGGVALLLGFGRKGLLDGVLEDWFGITLPFSTAGAVVAAMFVAMPFLVISLEGTLAGLDRRYEQRAASLGAGPWRVFRTVTLPLVAPGLLAGAALTWARALGEFGATITFAGNLPGVTQTLPLQVYLLLQADPAAATSVSLLLLGDRDGRAARAARPMGRRHPRATRRNPARGRVRRRRAARAGPTGRAPGRRPARRSGPGRRPGDRPGRGRPGRQRRRRRPAGRRGGAGCGAGRLVAAGRTHRLQRADPRRATRHHHRRRRAQRRRQDHVVARPARAHRPVAGHAAAG